MIYKEFLSTVKTLPHIFIHNFWTNIFQTKYEYILKTRKPVLHHIVKAKENRKIDLDTPLWHMKGCLIEMFGEKLSTNKLSAKTVYILIPGFFTYVHVFSRKSPYFFLDLLKNPYLPPPREGGGMYIIYTLGDSRVFIWIWESFYAIEKYCCVVILLLF